MFNYETIKKIMFNFEPETAHTIAEAGLKTLPYCRMINNYMVEQNFVNNPMLSQDIFGVTFNNPIGLGAGFDKNATMIKAMPAMGFGYTEIGTMTPKPQAGNPKPRLFRFPQEEAIQNAMGFNNEGALEVTRNLTKVYPYRLPIGASIGKNKLTPENMALEDYEILVRGFKDICDYMVVNISSPNTPNLRDLQNEEFIKAVFTMAKSITKKPILLKIAPDMEAETAITLCQTAIDSGADGIVATNTTQDYSLVSNPKDFGGISGKVMSDKSYELFKAIGEKLHDKTILISVGGISDAADAYRRIKAGASLIQILSGFIFKGPSMCKDINEGLIELLKADGYTHISQAIGADFK
ncbi:MAG: quinone-dependent dihydroorotate dehydrogenase [Campylobacteraceae bacterium]|jgi:dihydroorotate dehydrogenase|nr:quinone-dependent dihydroorotate dehydrogenase [Campylobacteraceae bacterium]MBT3882876.1 quinone-dependent dihydroorotate dehydrogenase [Campylobacteraceae bacterium]MBT4030808.1 quinone-dependent dihydroorotate dehydrogenase [Campylobacteraceae bacterium]MBT4179100.1 quinone-dependent dihydroorotate dehydrogenase [Campylobacteraceae bacterium]MBT4572934.1 quinone-dependent dihydroorotate dehydrogenase [Campylobacteraceae bacterium]